MYYTELLVDHVSQSEYYFSVKTKQRGRISAQFYISYRN